MVVPKVFEASTGGEEVGSMEGFDSFFPLPPPFRLI